MIWLAAMHFATPPIAAKKSASAASDISIRLRGATADRF
jgi:hypothetical protein